MILLAVLHDIASAKAAKHLELAIVSLNQILFEVRKTYQCGAHRSLSAHGSSVVDS